MDLINRKTNPFPVASYLSIGLMVALVQFGSSSAFFQKISVKGARSTGDQAQAKHASAEIPEATKQLVLESYGKLPLSFEANQGQIDPKVKFLSRGRGYTLFLTATEAVLVLIKDKAESQVEESPVGTKHIKLLDQTEQAVLRMRLLGTNPAPQVAGLEEMAGKSNYFIGNHRQKWRTHVPNYKRIRYRNVYPGIDLFYHGGQRQLEFDLVVAAGADPTLITLEFQGAEEIKIDSAEDLILRSNGNELRLHKPKVYQESNGIKQAIAAYYVLQQPGNEKRKNGGQTAVAIQMGIEVAAYDLSKPLIIDPVLSYSTYLGGGSGDYGNGIAVDGSGNVYLTGQTASTNFPTASPLQGANGGGYDAFVAKLNASGSALVYSTYLGGSSSDVGNGIAVDGVGNVYVTGQTASTNFPTTSPLQKANGGVTDAFVAEINASGSALVYSTYLGGSSSDVGSGIAVNGSGNAYVTGYTSSTNFPTGSPLQRANGGVTDAFVAELNASGSALVYSTYLGGSGTDFGRGIAVDGSGNAYVTGQTASTNFPTANPLQKANSGGYDAFVTKLNTSGSALVYSTYLGGSGTDFGRGIAVDGSGNAYVAGYTESTNFPTASPLQPANSGGYDAFVAKLNASGSALVYSTYLGGSGTDFGRGIAVDGSGNAYVAGYTESTNFPTASPLQAGYGGSTDAFVAELNASGSALVYSTYLGGSNEDIGLGIAVDGSGNVYVTGYTSSTNFPTGSSLQRASGGVTDAFVAKLQNTPSDCSLFNDFMNHVLVQSAKKLTVDQANQLTAAANKIKTLLGCL